MPPASSSDLEIAFAAIVTAGALASAAMLLVTIAVLRAVRRWRRWRLARREPAWHEALQRAIEDPAEARLPMVRSLELPDFANLWNRLQESVKGDATENLGQALRLAGIDRRLLAMLHGRSMRRLLIAITAMGHLREERAWPRLEALALGAGPVTSFAAARAMLRIEPRRALQVLGPSLAGRDDWPLARIGTILQELGPATVTPALVTLLIARPRKGLDRLVKLARFGHRERVAPVIRRWLSASHDLEVLAAALDYVEDRSDLPWAKGAARHAEWKVRMAAAKALGRVGGREELAPLLELLRDPVWWVRYHAAQSLIRLHGLDEAELELLRGNARDAFAADMLGQALAERGRR